MLHGLSSTLQKFFPVPAYLQMPAAGLDISDRSVKYFLFHTKGVKREIAAYGERQIPSNLTSAPADRAQFVALLKDIRKQLKTPFVRISVSEEKSYLFTTEIAQGGAMDARSAVETKLEENVPLPPGEVIFDFEGPVFQTGKDASGTTAPVSVSVSAVHRDAVRDRIRFCEEAGFIVLSSELETQALARAVVPAHDPSPYMIVDFGQVETDIAIVVNGVAAFTLASDIGGAALIQALMRDLSVTEAQAEVITKEYGFRKTPENEAAFASLSTAIQPLKEEINKQYVYWHTHTTPSGAPHPRIGKIILSGGAANLYGLTQYLSPALQTEVALADVWVNSEILATSLPKIHFSDSLRFATAIGLALRVE